MSESQKHVTVRGRADTHPAVELAVPRGTNLDALFANAELAAAIRSVRGRGGCAGCISGHPVFIGEEFEEVVAIQLEA